MQIPTQTFFTETFGLPLTMKPNFEDLSCEMVFGELPPLIHEDEVYNEPCFAKKCALANRDPNLPCPKIDTNRRQTLKTAQWTVHCRGGCERTWCCCIIIAFHWIHACVSILHALVVEESGKLQASGVCCRCSSSRNFHVNLMVVYTDSNYVVIAVPRLTTPSWQRKSRAKMQELLKS